LSALAVLFSIRPTFLSIVAASLLYTAAFSIYQSVIANAATIFVLWMLSTFFLAGSSEGFRLARVLRPLVAACASVIIGGILYVTIVWFQHIEFSAYQGAGEAFSLHHGFTPLTALKEVLEGTRSFFLWPEQYFPDFLKKLQLVLLFGAGILCLWMPRGVTMKIAAVTLLLITFLTPRLLQFIHPEGDYHNLTLTAYAVTIAGSMMIVLRSGYIPLRNLSMILSAVLVGGYIIQCSWISTVNYLNTLAHYATMTQILARVRSLPEPWNGEKVIVVGDYKMKRDYPYKLTTGVATTYIGAKFTRHMNHLARLMRDEAVFVAADETTPKALEYAMTHSAWPHPNSVGIVDDAAVVVFSNDTPTPGVPDSD
jgi:hypothetical protein